MYVMNIMHIKVMYIVVIHDERHFQRDSFRNLYQTNNKHLQEKLKIRPVITAFYFPVSIFVSFFLCFFSTPTR